MFLRWQRRENKRFNKYGAPKPDRGTVWSAIIVESARANGKPRQKHVAYLGTFTERGIGIVCQRGWYWEALARRLDSLSISPDERKKIESAFAEKVPPISKEEFDECVRGREAFYAVFKKRNPDA